MTSLAPNSLDALAVLAEPLRRRLYRAVVEAGAPLSRDDAAAALGIPRSTAAIHLDRLAAAGLLTTESRRRSGRTGPGAGRPTKLYSPASGDLLASSPERHYELAGELLATAAERADREGVPVRSALVAEAHRAGTAIGAAHAPLESALVACGYGPRDDGTGGIILDNCPFHALAERHTQLICSANVELVRGMAAASGDDREVALEPRAGHCCVAVHRRGD
ncbi:Predicted transcriptional regulator, ArsR family [Microbacterium sp. cf046]|uniref:helix-turn-helix transcriptional regulator n=1 Tax=Microbacterium sp. cf046 TaxID=1761803 RepID=UPI0008F135B6|nr:helix-turn-helix domain-containing protein [Microbacterium sp. cf046]SFS17355.1 Predicted transcriptional regulator, ArsR family [Microbacterium sp. cf046]